MPAMLESPTFWVAVAFVVFLALVWKPLGRLIGGALDSRSARIKEELDEAVRLREEAQSVLASYQSKQQQALKEAEEIVLAAKRDAEKMREEAKANLENTLDKRIKLATQKIAQAEKAVLEDVKNNAIDIAVGAARALIKEQVESGKAEDLVKMAMTDIERKLH